MTSQSSEKLTNEHPTFRLGEWAVFGLIRGEPSAENHGWGDREARVHQAVPPEAEAMTSANWKGYTEIYRLTPAGRLVLVRFDFDDSERPSVLANETLEGDLYLVVKSTFNGPRVYIPFRDGTIVLEQAQWLHEAYVGNSPLATELRRGVHPDFPRAARLWYERE